MIANEPTKYHNPELPIEERVADLVGRMTLDEKISQMMDNAPAIERLGIPEYDWWNECLHGVARAGRATVFPQAIGLAATFNTSLMHRVATAISDEARAKHHLAARQGYRSRYFGLTYWSPNINIFRDPRWGRGHETYGEDPFLTSRMGVAFVKGLQGDDPHYLKLVATPKHYAVHSGPEAERHVFDAVISPRDLRETYLAAFKACVSEGGAGSVMGAYNRVGGEACCASPTLLQKILREEWGFDGYVVSDYRALHDLHTTHHATTSQAETAAAAVRNGCDLNVGGEVYPALRGALARGLITEDEIDLSVRRLFTARFQLGMFDPEERVPYAAISPQVVACEDHLALARQAARESIVLLKNEDSILPLDKDRVRSIAVIGPNAMAFRPILGNYHGFSTTLVTPLAGVVGAVSAGTQVTYDMGCTLYGDGPVQKTSITWATEKVDMIVAVLGLSPEIEGEQAEEASSDGGGDRESIDLPGRQLELLRYLHSLGKPLVLVVLGGSCLDLNWAQENIPAIVWGWYPGEQGGNALADVLFGNYNPAGRLPVTFYKSLEQVPPFTDYNMKGRTYRFMNGTPLYHFGYGLSYTTFDYSDLRLGKERIALDEPCTVSATVTNTGSMAGDEAVQLYVRDVAASVPVPRVHMEGFQRVHLAPGESRRVSFTIQPAQLAAYDDHGKPFVERGDFIISIGGGQPSDPPGAAVSATLTVA